MSSKMGLMVDQIDAPTLADALADGWRTPCSVEPRLFFPPSRAPGEPGERPETRAAREQQAKAICATCPAMRLCRVAGDRSRDESIWGARGPADRAAEGVTCNWSGIREARPDYRRAG